MRALLRLLGLIALAGAFAAAIVDAARSFASGRIELMPIGDAITRASPDAVAHLRAALLPKLPLLWDPVLVTLLKAPGWVVLGVLGVLLLGAGRSPPPLIGHSRR